MKVLFWNLGKNDNRINVRNAIIEYEVNIAIFAEHVNTDMVGICHDLGEHYFKRDGFGGCNKIVMIARTPIIVTVSREDTRYVLYTIHNNTDKMIIAAVHLPANPGADSEIRKIVIRRLVHDIHELELKEACEKTIVIGDFNASPFDEEMIQKDCFNAVLFKDVILQAETVKVSGAWYKRFYNPIISFVSEKPKSYGSFYYTGGASPLYWYCLDQVIMRKALVNSFVNMQYVRSIAGKNLIKKAGINTSISDHLPLLVEFN